MEIKKQEFYHIHRIGIHSPIWQVGKRINWVHKNPNLFFAFYNSNAFVYNDGSQVLSLLGAHGKYINGDDTYKDQHRENIINLSGQIIKQLCIYIREVIFEEVRNNYFPHLPSRKSCIWLCEEDAVEYWWNVLSDDPNKKNKILKLSLTGTMHRTDQKFLIADTVKHDDIRAMAFEYWTGSYGENKIEQEILFEGIVDVLSEYNDLNEFKNT